MNHPSLRRAETRNKIIMAQEPVNLSRAEQERNLIEIAENMIANGLQLKVPSLVRRGRAQLRKIFARRFSEIKGMETISPTSASLLKNRRALYLEQVKEEKRKHDGNIIS